MMRMDRRLKVTLESALLQSPYAGSNPEGGFDALSPRKLENVRIGPRSESRVRCVETKEIVEKLERYTGVFPREAVQAAIENRESVIPELLRALEAADGDVSVVLDEGDYHLHVYALFLLAQFREKRAYPLVVSLVSRPGDVPFDLFGDAITEDLPSILASLSCGEIAPLKRIIENPGVNEYARAAALEALVTLVVCGAKERAEIIGYFKDLLGGGLEREHTFAWDALVTCCGYLHPEETYQEIRRAYAEGLVDPSYVGLEDVERAMKRNKDRSVDFLKSTGRFGLIEDTIASMEWWACFRSDSEKKRSAPDLTDEQLREILSDVQARREDALEGAGAPRGVKGRKVGRNERCPCGSGKKYKRCCGS